MSEYRAIWSTVSMGERHESLAGVIAVPESVPSDGDAYTPEHERALAERWARDKYDRVSGAKFERVEKIS